jgi:hypothetical protein
MSQSIPLASLEIRDAVFQELIRISLASNFMEELVAGPAGLLSRGLREEGVTRYGALPRKKQDRAVLAGSRQSWEGLDKPRLSVFFDDR